MTKLVEDEQRDRVLDGMMVYPPYDADNNPDAPYWKAKDVVLTGYVMWGPTGEIAKQWLIQSLTRDSIREEGRPIPGDLLDALRKARIDFTAGPEYPGGDHVFFLMIDGERVRACEEGLRNMLNLPARAGTRRAGPVGV